MGQAALVGSCGGPAKKQRGTAGGGADVLRGVLEIAGSQEVGAATRLAVAEALASVVARAATRGVGSSVEVTRSPAGPSSLPGTLRFAYAVRFTDPRVLAKARQALEREAEAGGRQRLLPRFLHALGTRSEAPAEELRIVDFSVESLRVPGKGDRVDDPDADHLLSLGCGTLAEGGNGVLESAVMCMSEQCGTGEFSDLPPGEALWDVQMRKRRKRRSHVELLAEAP